MRLLLTGISLRKINNMTLLRTLTAVCFALSIIACQSTDTAPASAPATASAEAAGPNIVFVRIDSLQAGYEELATELTRLEGNYEKAQANHDQRVRAFGAEVQKLQNQAQQGLLTPKKMQSEQDRLGRKEQEIQQQLQIALGAIQQDQTVLQQQFGERVKQILEEMMEENGYDYILNEGGGGGVLLANDTYDITPAVLAKLNASGSVMQADSLQ